MEMVKSEQYNNVNALKSALATYNAKLLKKSNGKLVYQSLNTGMIIVVYKFGYLFKVDYFKTCGVCE